MQEAAARESEKLPRESEKPPRESEKLPRESEKPPDEPFGARLPHSDLAIAVQTAQKVIHTKESENGDKKTDYNENGRNPASQLFDETGV